MSTVSNSVEQCQQYQQCQQFSTVIARCYLHLRWYFFFDHHLHRQVAATVMLLVMSLTLLSLANFRFLKKRRSTILQIKREFGSCAFLGSINMEVLIWLPLRDVGRENLCLRAQVRLRKQKLKSIPPVNTGMGISINQYQHQLQVLSSLIFRHCCYFTLV